MHVGELSGLQATNGTERFTNASEFLEFCLRSGPLHETANTGFHEQDSVISKLTSAQLRNSTHEPRKYFLTFMQHPSRPGATGSETLRGNGRFPGNHRERRVHPWSVSDTLSVYSRPLCPIRPPVRQVLHQHHQPLHSEPCTRPHFPRRNASSGLHRLDLPGKMTGPPTLHPRALC